MPSKEKIGKNFFKAPRKPKSNSFSYDERSVSGTSRNDTQTDSESGSDMASTITAISAAAAASSLMKNKDKKTLLSMLSVGLSIAAIATVLYVSYRAYQKIKVLKDELEKIKCAVDTKDDTAISRTDVQSITQEELKKILDEPVFVEPVVENPAERKGRTTSTQNTPQNTFVVVKKEPVDENNDMPTLTPATPLAEDMNHKVMSIIRQTSHDVIDLTTDSEECHGQSDNIKMDRTPHTQEISTQTDVQVQDASTQTDNFEVRDITGTEDVVIATEMNDQNIFEFPSAEEKTKED
jgi:hypothetical protein